MFLIYHGKHKKYFRDFCVFRGKKDSTNHRHHHHRRHHLQGGNNGFFHRLSRWCICLRNGR